MENTDFINFIDISKGLLTPIVAIIAVSIAYRQWRTEELKRYQSLVEKRQKHFKKLTCLYYKITLSSDTFSIDDIADETYELSSETMYLFNKNYHAVNTVNVLIQLFNAYKTHDYAEMQRIDNEFRKGLNLYDKYIKLDPPDTLNKYLPTYKKLFDKILNLLQFKVIKQSWLDPESSSG